MATEQKTPADTYKGTEDVKITGGARSACSITQLADVQLAASAHIRMNVAILLTR